VFIIASCAPACDPSYIFANQAPGDIRFWAIVALCCGVLLLAEAVVIAFRVRGHGMLTWRRAGALLPGVAGGIILVLVLRGRAEYMTLPTDPMVYFQNDITYPQLESAWQSAVTLGIATPLGTVALHLIGFFSLAAKQG